MVLKLLEGTGEVTTLEMIIEISRFELQASIKTIIIQIISKALEKNLKY